jgi:hypothetical protein
MAGMNLGMSERNDTMAAHRSVVAVRNSNWAETRSIVDAMLPCVAKGTDPPPADRRGGRDRRRDPCPLAVRPAGAVVGMAAYATKAMLHGQWKRRVGNASGECSLHTLRGSPGARRWAGQDSTDIHQMAAGSSPICDRFRPLASPNRSPDCRRPVDVGHRGTPKPSRTLRAPNCPQSRRTSPVGFDERVTPNASCC